jgi:hypothetical protein
MNNMWNTVSDKEKEVKREEEMNNMWNTVSDKEKEVRETKVFALGILTQGY